MTTAAGKGLTGYEKNLSLPLIVRSETRFSPRRGEGKNFSTEKIFEGLTFRRGKRVLTFRAICEMSAGNNALDIIELVEGFNRSEVVDVEA